MRSFRYGLAGALLAACGGGDAPARHDAADAGGDTVYMTVAWEIAPAVHPAADSLGQVSGVALDPAGNVYVTDMMAARIWVFDSTGALAGSFGRKGQGPGEFDAPTGPAVGPDGRLYIRDVYRVSVFGPDSATGLLTALERTFNGPVYADWTSTRATRFDDAGAVLYPGQQWRAGGTARPYVLRFTPEGTPADTIAAPDHPNAPQLTAFVQTSPSGGRMLRGLNHVPFAPLPVWDATPAGTVISGDGRTYSLAETDAAGAVLTRFERDVAPDRIPADERRDSSAALRARLDSVPVPLDQVQGMPEEVRTVTVPEVYPAYMAVYVSADGQVWVRRWPVGGGDRTIFDVFARTGEYRRTVVLPRAIGVVPTPYISAAQVIGVATDPHTDEGIIIRFTPGR